MSSKQGSEFAKLWQKKRLIYLGKKKSTEIYPFTKRPRVIFDDYIPLVTREQQFNFEDNHYYMPIVRYESYSYASAKTALSTKSKYCGFFSYFEPSSSIVLDLGKTMIFPDKVSCARWLRQRFDPNDKLEILNKPYLGGTLETTIRDNTIMCDKLEKKLDSIREEIEWTTRPTYIAELENQYRNIEEQLDKISGECQKFRSIKIRPKYPRIMSNWSPNLGDPWWVSRYDTTEPSEEDYKFFENIIMPFYEDLTYTPQDLKIHPLPNKDAIGPVSVLYPTIKLDNFVPALRVGDCDNIDQYICLLGHHAGYDTFVLQHEIGGYRAVTEIIDMRNNPRNFIRDISDVFPNGVPFQRFSDPSRSVVSHEHPMYKDITQSDDPLLSTIWFPSDKVLVCRRGKLVLADIL